MGEVAGFAGQNPADSVMRKIWRQIYHKMCYGKSNVQAIIQRDPTSSRIWGVATLWADSSRLKSALSANLIETLCWTRDLEVMRDGK